MTQEIELLVTFLNKIKLNISKKNTQNISLNDFINNNFNILNESVLRLLITEAFKDRDSNVLEGYIDDHVLGRWGLVIDSIKDITLKRRDLAIKNFQGLVGIGNEEGILGFIF